MDDVMKTRKNLDSSLKQIQLLCFFTATETFMTPLQPGKIPENTRLRFPLAFFRLK